LIEDHPETLGFVEVALSPAQYAAGDDAIDLLRPGFDLVSFGKEPSSLRSKPEPRSAAGGKRRHVFS
jgi:hypothetical protein